MKVYGPPLPTIGANGPEFPLLWQDDSRIVIPQLPYVCDDSQEVWSRRRPIYFFTQDRLGVKLSDVLKGEFEGMNESEHAPFGDNCHRITLWVHVRS